MLILGKNGRILERRIIRWMWIVVLTIVGFALLVILWFSIETWMGGGWQ